MENLKITNIGYTPVTVVPDSFIVHAMPAANGEYVKIYLYLLYSFKNNTIPSVSSLADLFQCTENDIRRALKYWESKQLLCLEEAATDETVKLEVPVKPEVPVKQSYSATETKAFKEQANIKQLLFACEAYMGKQLTRTDIETLLYFYEQLHFSPDLIEYLVEYSISKNKRSLRYMEAIAVEWHKKGIRTVDEAKQDSKPYAKECYLVLKALGINNHDPLPAEINYVNRWMNEYGFTIELILEACSRTMMQIHNPRFEYVDGILRSWKTSGIRHLSDLEKADAEHKPQTGKKAPVKTDKQGSSRFRNFEERTYDFRELEKKLFEN